MPSFDTSHSFARLVVHCFWRLPQGSFTAGWVAKRQTSRCNSRGREINQGRWGGWFPGLMVSFHSGRVDFHQNQPWHIGIQGVLCSTKFRKHSSKVQKTFQQFNIVDWNIHTLFDLGLLLPVGYGGLVYQITLRPRTPWKIWTGIWGSWNTSEKTEELELEHVPKSKKKHIRSPKCQNVKVPKIQVFHKKRSIQGGPALLINGVMIPMNLGL